MRPADLLLGSADPITEADLPDLRRLVEDRRR